MAADYPREFGAFADLAVSHAILEWRTISERLAHAHGATPAPLRAGPRFKQVLLRTELILDARQARLVRIVLNPCATCWPRAGTRSFFHPMRGQICYSAD
jgi:hypothetical protein